MPPTEASLLDVLIDGFEKNEVVSNYHWRDLPCPTEADARARFTRFRDEATAWKGQPQVSIDDGARRKVAWSDMEILQVGRGVQIRVRSPWFGRWWHQAGTWEADPMAGVWKWWEEERKAHRERVGA